MTESTQANETSQERQVKVLKGVVVSAKMDKTITIQVERLTKHPRYHKYVRARKKFYAHDENNEASVGDHVVIEGTRPLSKTKRWRLKEITRKSEI